MGQISNGLCPGQGSPWAHWCCLPQKFHKYLLSLYSAPGVAATASGLHRALQDTNTTPFSTSRPFLRKPRVADPAPAFSEGAPQRRKARGHRDPASNYCVSQGKRPGWAGAGTGGTYWCVLSQRSSSELQQTPAVPDELRETESTCFFSEVPSTACYSRKVKMGWWEADGQDSSRTSAGNCLHLRIRSGRLD